MSLYRLSLKNIWKILIFESLFSVLFCISMAMFLQIAFFSYEAAFVIYHVAGIPFSFGWKYIVCAFRYNLLRWELYLWKFRCYFGNNNLYVVYVDNNGGDLSFTKKNS